MNVAAVCANGVYGFFFFFCLWVSHEVVFFRNFRKLIYMNPVICSVIRDRKVGRSGGECSVCGSLLKSRENWDIGCFNSAWRAVGGKGASQPHCALLSMSRCSLSLLSFLSALCLFFLILWVIQECLFFPLMWFQRCRWFYEALVCLVSCHYISTCLWMLTWSLLLLFLRKTWVRKGAFLFPFPILFSTEVCYEWGEVEENLWLMWQVESSTWDHPKRQIWWKLRVFSWGCCPV